MGADGFPAHAGMDPCHPPHGAKHARFPRTRGDGPYFEMLCPFVETVSPHTRGWTPAKIRLVALPEGFPAHAGMDPRSNGWSSLGLRFPRTRGDGPRALSPPAGARAVSPHTRGWTHARPSPAWRGVGFPAHAGMDPISTSTASSPSRFPRTRGDGPVLSTSIRRVPKVSPHTRGWTHAPAHQPDSRPGFPAHAGMDPCRPSRGDRTRRFPRTRGDGPVGREMQSAMRRVSPHTRGWTLIEHPRPTRMPGFPAHAGMDPGPGDAARGSGGFPRTRGDGPGPARTSTRKPRVSPHTRGWTENVVGHALPTKGFPAHAGMDPDIDGAGGASDGFPRTRGDGPDIDARPGAAAAVSPHTRGWTADPARRIRRPRGFPAHAGMDPRSSSASSSSTRFPRTRGDGPGGDHRHRVARRVSPHTRGWTPVGCSLGARGSGFPAHAGITRGWTRVLNGNTVTTTGSPAHAGMDRVVPDNCNPSMAPPAMAILATGATMRNGRALTSAMTPKSVTETARAATRGHIPAWASVSARARKNKPIATPDGSASPTPGGSAPARTDTDSAAASLLTDCQRSSKTDKFLTLIDLIGSGTRFSVDLDVGGREMAVGAVGNRVLGGFPSSLWARSLRPWGSDGVHGPGAGRQRCVRVA